MSRIDHNPTDRYHFLNVPAFFTYASAPWRWFSLIKAAQSLAYPAENKTSDYKLLLTEQSTTIQLDDQSDESPSDSPSRYHCFFDGVETVTQFLWPWGFYGLFSYDLYQYYVHSNNRYQLQLADLLLGVPQNYSYQYASLTVNLGGDIASTALRWLNYWPWTLLVSAAVVRGLANVFYSRKIHTIDLEALALPEQKRIRPLRTQIVEDILQPLFFPTDFNIQLFSLQHALINDHHYTELKENSHETIQQMIEHRRWLAQYSGIAALANLYYYSHNPSLRHNVLNILTQSADFKEKRDPVAVLYARYKLWSIGKSSKKWVSLMCYSLILPLQCYAQFRFWSLLVNKIIGLVNFEIAKRHCQADQKIYHYVGIKGNYECTVCDWDFVDYRTALSGQGCLDQLLTIETSPADILHKLPSLQAHAPFTRLDFSKQPWTQWPMDDWQNLMNYLQSPPFNQIMILNLSQPAGSIEAVSPYLLKSVADYLQQAAVTMIDLSYLTLSQQSMSALLPGLTDNDHTVALNFTGCGMDDVIAAEVIPVIYAMPALQTLSFRDNALTGASLSVLSDSPPSLIDLDVAHNDFIASDIEAFANTINDTALTKLDMSGVDFSTVDMNIFGKGIQNGALIELIMAGCSLTDQQASTLFLYFSNTTLHTLNWSNNYIGYTGLASISKNLPLSPLTHFILDDNTLNDDAIALLGSAITAPNSSLIELSVSGNTFGLTGFAQFVRSLNNSSLHILQVARNNIGDAGVQALISAAADPIALKALNFNHIGMTYQSASDLFYWMSNQSLTVLDVSDNAILAAAGAPLFAALNNTNLSQLSLQNTQISSDLLLPALSALPHSALRRLDLSFNPLDDATAVELAKILIEETPNADHWLNTEADSIDFNRAVACAHSSTALDYLDLSHTQISDLGEHALRLVTASTRVADQDLLLPDSSPPLLNQPNYNLYTVFTAAVCSPTVEKLIPVLIIFGFILFCSRWLMSSKQTNRPTADIEKISLNPHHLTFFSKKTSDPLLMKSAHRSMQL